MRRRAVPLALTVLAAAGLLPPARPAAADPSPAPPPGWEQPPPLPAPAPRTHGKPVLPACCGQDATCCDRQQTIDAVRPDRVARVVEVRLADLPEVVVKEAPKDHPGIPGVPAVRAIDGHGRPFPWPDGPQLELRVMPPGRFGSIRWRSEWSDPFFADPQYRGMGYGQTIGTDPHYRREGAPKPDLSGDIAFTAIDKPGERVVWDAVEGRLEGTPNVAATRWEHVEAATLFDSYVHGWRETKEGATAVIVLLPQVVLGFESRDAKHSGGFLMVRGSSAVSYTRYTLPCGADKSALVTFDFRRWGGDRWFARPAGAEPLPESRTMALVASQTSVEPEPRVRLLIFQ